MTSHKFIENTSEYLHKIASQALVIIPVGSVEQHGPHLPVGSDSYNVQQIAEMAAEKTQNKMILVAPTLWYGSSHHHLGFGGCMSLGGKTLLAVLCDLGNSLVTGGVKKIFFLNGHGGNRFMLREAAKELVNEYNNDVIIGSSDYWEIAREALADIKIKTPGHAGSFETALQMARDEKLVDYDAIKHLINGTKPDSKDYQYRIISQAERDQLRFQSLRSRGNINRKDAFVKAGGISEVPEFATRELGEQILTIVVDEVAKFFVEFWEHS